MLLGDLFSCYCILCGHYHGHSRKWLLWPLDLFSSFYSVWWFNSGILTEFVLSWEMKVLSFLICSRVFCGHHKLFLFSEIFMVAVNIVCHCGYSDGLESSLSWFYFFLFFFLFGEDSCPQFLYILVNFMEFFLSNFSSIDMFIFLLYAGRWCGVSCTESRLFLVAVSIRSCGCSKCLKWWEWSFRCYFDWKGKNFFLYD